MTARRHINHVHSGWPAPYTGVIAAVLFAIAVLVTFNLLLSLSH